MRWFAEVPRCLLGLVFLTSGLLKGMSAESSVIAVASFHLTPPWGSLAVGLVMPGIEIVAAISLLANSMVRGAATITAALSTVFFSGVLSAMLRRIDLDCGCFGHLAIAPRAGLPTLSLDATLLALSLFVLLRPRYPTGSALDLAPARPFSSIKVR